MSAIALAIVASQLVIYGNAREPDEGAAAHLWQLLMAGQVPLIGWFMVRQLPIGFGRAAPVLAAQVVAIALAAAPVALLGL
jgi:hypothetical protein